MNIGDTVEYINAELKKGKTFKSIELELGFNDRVLYKRLTRKGYKRSNDGYKPFILVGKDDTPEANVNNKPTTSKGSNNSNTLTIEEIKQLKNLLSRYNDILHILDNNTIHIQDIYNIDNINIIQTNNTKQKIFRVDIEVLEKWNSFCNKYKHIKVQSLVSTALLEFIDKYNK